MTGIREVSLVTSNPTKVVELQRILGMLIKQQNLDIPEIQALDPMVVAKQKAEEAYARLKTPVLVEDSGLAVAAWGEFPGALVKWMIGRRTHSIGLEKFCAMVPADDRAAKACSVLVLYDGHDFVTGAGCVRGTIAPEPRGHNGYAWDPIFIPAGEAKTFGEMAPMAKDKVSARSLAVAELKKKI
jgi:XTP/dITP diphosphohydrolase